MWSPAVLHRVRRLQKQVHVPQVPDDPGPAQGVGQPERTGNMRVPERGHGQGIRMLVR